ncbi:SAP domain-containing ribonucleoprotein [Paramicrosporidium saccamoebae]|uniref:SAP domain-containing ribonucleoprotein n=1 Tax=Paramicrosporidium saccamoebae TaxID=1246581 RepID=A0A2H9TIN7_9FUNG|nr:SAP domain-containing ribonucleoprotein [Paramicrosporidium saccamoebae]
MDESAVRQLKVAELRGELTKLGLPTGGKKDELQTRLIEALQASAVSNQTKSANPSRPSKPISPTSPTSQPAAHAPSDRMAERAARFKIEPVGSGDERLKKRKERFGSISEDFFDMEKLRARQARFGVVTSERLAQDDMNAQKVKRLQRFGLNS